MSRVDDLVTPASLAQLIEDVAPAPRRRRLRLVAADHDQVVADLEEALRDARYERDAALAELRLQHAMAEGPVPAGPFNVRAYLLDQVLARWEVAKELGGDSELLRSALDVAERFASEERAKQAAREADVIEAEILDEDPAYDIDPTEGVSPGSKGPF